MAQSEGFKHITVTAPEEDDIVILAGMGQPSLGEAEALERGEGLAAEPMAEAAERGRADSGPERRESAARQRAGRSQDDGRPTDRKALGRSGRFPEASGDGYRETTLEDLERQPMPFAQRVVVIAAVVCIIGAVIYCLAFMG